MSTVDNTAFDKDAFKLKMGKYLQYLRVMNSLSLEDMGKKMGVTPQQIHKYETGETTVSSIHLRHYADIFQVPVAYFFGEAGKTAMPDCGTDRKAMMAAAEIAALPGDIRMGLYHMARIINRELRGTYKKAV